ncbi:hypothetical protein JDW21_18835 [Bacillus subtilis]|uniref:hypothetical protein n=1 Tax=Bacillus subtilis TaxID=1423 RepID=UPI002ED12502
MENTKKTFRVNKTQNRLKEAWTKLDEACGLLYDAGMLLERMTDIPTEAMDSFERVDKSSIVNCRDIIGKMINDDVKSRGDIKHIIK